MEEVYIYLDNELDMLIMHNFTCNIVLTLAENYLLYITWKGIYITFDHDHYNSINDLFKMYKN